MAQLSSPGVSVSVIDESFYTAAGAGTIPLIIVASASNKLTGSGTGIAPGTISKNDGKLWLLTSQKDLSDTFGTPVFKTDTNNNPIHAGEQNEYGLQAAYSYLGVSNRAYVARAPIDLNQLDGKTAIPGGQPEDGTMWLETHSTHWGVFVWNSDVSTTPSGQTFTNIVPTVITDSTKVVNFSAHDYAPKSSIGSAGTYAIVAVSSLTKLWYKKFQTQTAAGLWVEVGSDEWKASFPTVQATIVESAFAKPLYNLATPVQTRNGDPVDAITINSITFTDFDTLQDLADKINASTELVDYLNDIAITAAVIKNKLELYSTGIAIDLDGTLTETANKIGLSIDPVTLYKAPTLQISSHTQVPLFKRKDLSTTNNGRPTGSVWIKTSNVNRGADFVVSKYNAKTQTWVSTKAPLYANGQSALADLDPNGGGLNLAANTLYVKYNDPEAVYEIRSGDEGEVLVESSPSSASFKLYRRSDVTATVIESAPITTTMFASGTYTFNITESLIGSTELSSHNISFVVNEGDSSSTIIDTILEAFNSLSSLSNIEAAPVGATKISISHKAGGELLFVDAPPYAIRKMFDPTNTTNFYHRQTNSTNAANMYIASLWTEYNIDRSASFVVSSENAPLGKPVDGQLWYDANRDDVDIMINDGNKRWKAYRNFDHGQGEGATDPKGPIISATKPTLQSDKTALVEGDLWIDSSDTENYPQIYKYINFTKQWDLVDKTDQTTENGILFDDARWNTNGVSLNPSTIVELLGGSGLSDEARVAADFLDFDAPNPALYPKGMLLWNLRRSGFNVKRYAKKYVNKLDRNLRTGSESMINYNENVWVSEAANNEDGSGAFGRHAQRKVVVQSMQALVNKNQAIREEELNVFNLIACPGYPELVGEMKILNYDRGITAFVVADTPARLTADATSLSNWGKNVALAVEDNDYGLASSDEYMAFFYPWGYTSDNIGNNIVVPPSYMILRTIALSDNISYPWFAPAGTSRGVINNATAVGYVDAGGEFKTVALNAGQRDTLAEVKVNPITFIAGSGLVNFGQYTRASKASSLDRINVARLVVFLRRQFSLLARPYLFEPNDEATRKQIKHAAEAMLLELMGQRALYDYVVVCDSSNNTPARIDRSELYLDIAIEPTKAVEFIYIPLRLKNTGEIKGLG